MGDGKTPFAAALRFEFMLNLFHWTLLQVACAGKKIALWTSVIAVQQRSDVGKQTDLKRAKARSSPPVSGSKSKKRNQATLPKSTPGTHGPNESSECYAEKDRPDTATDKRIRAIRKKLREIEVLEEKMQSTGRPLELEAAEKVALKPALEEEVETLKARAILEAKEIAEKRAAEAKLAAEKAFAAKIEADRVASERAAVAAALARAKREALEVIPNISPGGEAARQDPRLKALLGQVSSLSDDVFHEDCLANEVSKKGGWRLTLLARPVQEDPENRPPEDPDVLLGFIVYRVRSDMQCLSIAKIAVPAEHRGRGFGKRLMEWCTKFAQQQGSLQYLSLSSLPEAVKFYQRYGFRAVKVETVAEGNEELIDGQVYMEYRLKGSQKR